MSTPEPEPEQEKEQLADQLMDEATSLARDLTAHLDELLQSGLDAIKLIRAQQEASQALGAVGKLGHVLAGNGTITKRMQELLNMVPGILHEWDNGNYAEQIRQVTDAVSEIDEAKLAVEDTVHKGFLQECYRRRDNVLAARAITSACAASVEIQIFFLAFAHSDILRAYVDKPPLSRRALDNASELVRSAALDYAGTVIPFLGTALTVLQVMQPWIKREEKRIKKAMPIVDRMFNLDDGLTGLANSSAQIEASTRQVAEFISEYRQSFADDVQWLTDMARKARRS